MGLFGKRAPQPEMEVVSDPPSWARRTVSINLDPVALPGDLVTPADATAVVIFAHGSGSSRRSPRNIEVADRLNRDGLGTLLFDLLTPGEAEHRERVFDIELLARRLEGAARWVRRWPALSGLPIAFFGASTGAGAALVATARLRSQIAAVVSRGGRPDLAGDALERVTAPTLLIVGGEDPPTLAANRDAERRLRCEKRLEIVPGAGHLFEEPGAMDRVAELASSWVRTHALGGRASLSDVH